MGIWEVEVAEWVAEWVAGAKDVRRAAVRRCVMRGLMISPVPADRAVSLEAWGPGMNSQPLHDKVQAFAQRLLDEAHGDPVRALGLLVLVLDDAELESGDHVHRLVAQVRKVLVPEHTIEQGRPVQHLAGEASWEGIQHCLRCGKVLTKPGREATPAILSGYVYEVGSRVTAEDCDEFDSCR